MFDTVIFPILIVVFVLAIASIFFKMKLLARHYGLYDAIVTEGPVLTAYAVGGFIYGFAFHGHLGWAESFIQSAFGGASLLLILSYGMTHVPQRSRL